MTEFDKEAWEAIAFDVGANLLLTIGNIAWHGGANPVWLLSYLRPRGSGPRDMAARILLDYIRWTLGDQDAGDRLRASFASRINPPPAHTLKPYPN
jgi:hypothetical protein